MKRSNLLVAVAVAGSMFGSLAAAQVIPGGQQNFRGPAQVREVREDRWDLKRLESLQDRIRAATRFKNKRTLGAVDAELRSYMSAELREQQIELVEARQDLRDGRARRSEVRELREDRRDLTRLRQIDGELKDLYGRVSRPSLNRRVALVDELVDLARKELKETRGRRPNPNGWR